jgi:hypothetical protein
MKVFTIIVNTQPLPFFPSQNFQKGGKRLENKIPQGKLPAVSYLPIIQCSNIGGCCEKKLISV